MVTSSKSFPALPPGSTVLVHGPNWLGDAVMSMPALQAFHEANPAVRIVMLTKPRIAGLWKLHPAVGQVVTMAPGTRGVWKTARQLRRHAPARAYICSNSFRSALVTLVAGIPSRVGMAGHARRMLLTNVTPHTRQQGVSHQAAEYFTIFGSSIPPGGIPAPRLALSPEAVAAARAEWAADGRPLIALIPGAAYGPSKRWPGDRFAAVGREARANFNARVVVCGTHAEHELCAAVCEGAGGDAVNLAGKTDLAALAVVLSLCCAAVTNDSGGMHLASALGCRVVAVYGITDPTMTGPLGPGHHVLQSEGVARSRDLQRDSTAASAALQSVTVSEVVSALADIMPGAAS